MVVMANAQGVNTGQLAMRAYEIVAPTIRTAVKATSTKGLRRKTLVAVPMPAPRDGFAGEVAFFPWEDGLGSIGLPTTDPMSGLTKWKKTGEHTFRRVRKDETLAESLQFETDADGKPARIISNTPTGA